LITYVASLREQLALALDNSVITLDNLTEPSMIFCKFAVLTSLFASSAAVIQVVAPAPLAPVKEKKICRSEVPLGSIMSKRVCHTKSEWAQIRGKDSENAARALDTAHRGVPGTPASTD
jgi:hypothetical protein